MSRNAVQPRAPRRRHLILVAVIVVLALPVLAAAVLVASFNPNRYAPQIVAAVERATGRPLTIGGPITLGLSLRPVIVLRQLSLANPPGFPDASLATLDRVEAQLALLPLLSHRIDILHLHLVDPRIVLERDSAGTPNWIFAPAPASPSAAPASPPAAPAPASAGQTYKVALQEVDVSNGQLTINNKAGAPTIISLPSFSGTAASLDAPLHLMGNAEIGATPFTLAGTVGSIALLSGGGNWPVDLTFTLGNATAHVAGRIAHPLLLKGYDANVTAEIPALDSLTGSLPAAWTYGMTLPAVQNLTAAARIVDQDSLIPAIDHLTIKAGAADLSAFRPGLALSSLDIEMASLDQPLSLQAAATLNGTALSLNGHFGPPQALLPRAWLPASMPPQVNYPVTAQAAFGNASLNVNGAIATPENLSGAALSLSATIPELAALSPLAGTQLPAWKNISAQATLLDPGGQGLRNAVGVQNLAVTMDNAAFGGDASLFLTQPAKLVAALTASQLNLDALLASLPRNPPPAPATPSATQAPAPSNAGAAPNSWAAAKIPVSWLHEGNADLQLAADRLVWNQTTYSALQLHAVLNNAVLTLAPVTGQLPGGSVSASAVIDASHDPASESLKFNAPAMAAGPLLKAFNLPASAQGTVQVQLDASGQGDSLQPILASVNGQLGLAMVNGVVDGTVLDGLFGSVLHAINLPTNLVGAQGPVMVRCMATRLDATNGLGTFRALALDSSRLRIQGSGTVNFGTDALNLTLRPQVRISGTNFDVPVHVGGSLSAPSTAIAPGKTGPQSLLGELANSLGLGGSSASSADICPAALSLARMGQPGPAPQASTNAPAANPSPLPAGPTNLLNAILGK